MTMKAKNLAFFKRYYPGIYAHFVNYQMQNEKVNILPQTGEVDILCEGRSLYAEQSQAYAKREVATFLASFDYGSRISSVKPIDNNTYQNPRTFALSLDAVYRYYHKKERNFKGYRIPDFFPLVVFTGCGLGQHIRVLTSVRTVRHAILLENNMDRFAASLYAVDWEAVVTPFRNDPDRSFQFVLVPSDDEEQVFGSLWNALLTYCPLFPLTTLFYNHKGSPFFDRLSDRVNADLYVHLFSFGNFDDELNQLNNALHNFRNNTPLLRAPSGNQTLPVCVVGAGPSLDGRADDLRQLQEAGALIISCGTALASLQRLGIRVDIHVELESDYLTYRLQKQSCDEDYLKGICLVGAAQLNPMLVSLFGDARLFFKDDGSLAHIFADPADIVPNATPTCTNAALAFVRKSGFQEVYLFGLDYGFIDSKYHHAKGSVYYSENMKSANEEKYGNSIEIPAAGGGLITTTPFFFSSKRRIENLIRTMNGVQLHNCSDGAKIEGADWIPKEQLQLDKGRFSTDKQQFLIMFNNHRQYPVWEKIVKEKQDFCADFQELIRLYQSELDKSPIDSLSGFVDYCSFVRTSFENLLVRNAGLYFFIRGSIWHFLYAGYSHLLTMEESETGDYCQYWCEKFSLFLTKSCAETKRIVAMNRAMWEDELVSRSIADPRECDRELLHSKLQWDYEQILIENGQCFFDDLDWKYAGYGFNGKKFLPYEEL